MESLNMEQAEDLLLDVCNTRVDLQGNPKALDWVYTMVYLLNERLKELED